MRRRTVLSALIAVGALSLAAAGFQGQPQGPKVLRMQSMGVRDNLYLLSGGGGNTAALLADDGIVLVDSKLAGWGQPLLDALRRGHGPAGEDDHQHAHPRGPYR